MKIDGDALSKACSSDTACNVYNNLCGSELNVVLDQLKETQNSNKNLLIAYNGNAISSEMGLEIIANKFEYQN